jgi:serine/threonine protein kinase
MESSTRNACTSGLGAYESKKFDQWKCSYAGRQNNARSIDGMELVCRSKQCTMCARLPFHRPNIYSAILNNDDGFLDSEGVFFDAISRINEFEMNERGLSEVSKVDDAIAQQTADAAEEHVETLRAEMTERGLLQHQDQNFAGEAKRARVVAPIRSDEIQLGTLLGVGGFSTVLEISRFSFDNTKSVEISDTCEKLSREFLSRNAMRYPDHAVIDNITDDSVATKSMVKWRRKNASLSCPEPRYALKHLRHTLANEPEKYQRACIDLVLEGQFLLAMDHPNIIGIRGWPMLGTDAIRSGRLSDYFLILDRLPETLEYRMWVWRKSLRKYKARCSFPWFQAQKYCVKIENLFKKRLHAVSCVANAIEYMHDKRIIHRDIKSANIGFDIRGELKLFDFGLSRIIPRPSVTCSSATLSVEEFTMSRVGTKFYMAPEVKNKKRYSLPADVYSFGVLFWEILSLSSPRDFYYETKRLRKCDGALIENLPQGHSVDTMNPRRKSKLCCATEDTVSQRPIDGTGWLPICRCWPDAVRGMIVSCLTENPGDRPSMSEIQQNLNRFQLDSSSAEESIDEERRRRRSTFRLDISLFQNTPTGLPMSFEASGESKTSISSCDYCMPSNS